MRKWSGNLSAHSGMEKYKRGEGEMSKTLADLQRSLDQFSFTVLGVSCSGGVQESPDGVLRPEISSF